MESVRAEIEQARQQVDHPKEQWELADEQAQIDRQVEAGQDLAEEGASRMTGEIAAEIDTLDDKLFFPLDVIALNLVKIMEKITPQLIAKMFEKMSNLFSTMPCSGLFHTIAIDLLPLYLFYYSTYSTWFVVVKVGTVAEKIQRGSTSSWADPKASEKCFNDVISGILWARATKNPAHCVDKDQVYDPLDASDAEKDNLILFGFVNMACFLLCECLWLIVIGNFLFRNKFWVSLQNSTYFKNSFLAKRSRLYRFVAGLIGLGCPLGVGVVIYVAHKYNIVFELFRNVLPTIIATVVTARPILMPTKPKFEYVKGLDEVMFKRSFLTTNGSFAGVLGDALMQCNRSRKFNKKLKSLLAKPDEWEKVWRVCLMERSETDSHSTFPTLLARAEGALNDGGSAHGKK